LRVRINRRKLPLAIIFLISLTVILSTSAHASPSGSITIKGKFEYVDEFGVNRPMQQVKVFLMDDDVWEGSPSDEEVAVQYTGDDGSYSFTVNNDDGLDQDGRDPYILVESSNIAAIVKTALQKVYTLRLPRAGENVADGFTYDYGTTSPTENNEAWQALEAILKEHDWILSQVGWERPTIVTVNWPSRTYPLSLGDVIHLPSRTVFSWDRLTVYNVYGLSVLYTLYGNDFPDCYNGNQQPDRVFGETDGTEALVEGWADFLQAAVENNPDNLKDWFRGHGGNIETNDWFKCIDVPGMDGGVIEGSMASVFWDIWDPANDDPLSLGLDEIFHIIRDFRPIDVNAFWKNFATTYPAYAGDLATIGWMYGIDKDVYPARGSIVINSGDTYTKTRSVTLTVSGFDYGSGVAYMRFSNSPSVSGKWKPYATSAPWTLPIGDGVKTVYAQFRDKKGLMTPAPFPSDTIILDTVPPTGSITINTGDPYTPSQSVTLTLTYFDATSGVSQVRYSNDGVWDTEPWEPPSGTKAWTLTAGDGTKTVYYQIRDSAGWVSTTYLDTIILDTVPPTGSISISAGATYTTTQSVTLTLTYSDAGSGVWRVRYSNDGVWDTEPWQAPSPTKAWVLTPGDGTKTVHYQIQDNAGLVSTYLDTIILDNTPPTGSIIIEGGDPYATSQSVTLTLTYFDAGSGVSQVRYSNDGTWDTEPWETPSPTKAWTLTVGDGTKTVYYQIKDSAGLVSTTYLDTIVLDSTPPTGSIIINAGEPCTTSESVMLALTYFDATSGVSQVRYSNDGTSWTLWEPPSETKAWTLTTGDGAKTVYYQIQDNAGLVSTTYLDTIILDRVPPTGSIIINAGATYTTSPTVTLTLTYFDATSGVSQVRYSNDGTWDTEPWETPSPTKAWILTEGDGAKAVYYQIQDNAGLESGSYMDTIVLDSTAPTGSIIIEGGDPYATSQSVTLTLTYFDADSGVWQVRYSNDGVWDTEPWEAPSTTKPWTLTAGDGSKTVYYQIQDNAGLVSTYQDTIILDNTPPTGSIIINTGDAYTTSPIVTLTLTYSDATSGVKQVRFRNSGGAWSPWESPTLTKTWTLPLPDGSKTVEYQIEDNAGKLSSTYSDSISLDTTAPTTTASHADRSRYVYLSASDGVASTKYRIDSGPWYTYPGSIYLTGPAPYTHIIDYYSVDNAGNQEAVKTLKVHYLTVETNVPEVTPVNHPSSTEGWYTDGVTVSVLSSSTAAPDTYWVGTDMFGFQTWEIDTKAVSGNPITIVMSEPHWARAGYLAMQVWFRSPAFTDWTGHFWIRMRSEVTTSYTLKIRVTGEDDVDFDETYDVGTISVIGGTDIKVPYDYTLPELPEGDYYVYFKFYDPVTGSQRAESRIYFWVS